MLRGHGTKEKEDKVENDDFSWEYKYCITAMMPVCWMMIFKSHMYSHSILGISRGVEWKRTCEEG